MTYFSAKSRSHTRTTLKFNLSIYFFFIFWIHVGYSFVGYKSKIQWCHLFFVSKSDKSQNVDILYWVTIHTLTYTHHIFLALTLSLFHRYDDSTVTQVTDAQVLKPKPPRMPYLLMYRRHDTLPPHRVTKPEWEEAPRCADQLYQYTWYVRAVYDLRMQTYMQWRSNWKLTSACIGTYMQWQWKCERTSASMKNRHWNWHVPLEHCRKCGYLCNLCSLCTLTAITWERDYESCLWSCYVAVSECTVSIKFWVGCIRCLK